MKETLDIYGMSCAACAAKVHKAAEAVPGVKKAEVNLLKNTLTLDYDVSQAEEDELLGAVMGSVEHAGYKVRSHKKSTASQKEQTNKEPVSGNDIAQKICAERFREFVVSLIFELPLFYISMGHMFSFPQPHWPQLFLVFALGTSPQALSFDLVISTKAIVEFLLLVPIVIVNRHYFIGGFKALVRRSPTMDSLVALGCTASILYGYFDSAGMILTLVTLGKYFEARAKGKTSTAIEQLIDLAPKKATLIKNGVKTTVDAKDLCVGDRLLVRAGETLAADGYVVEGTALIDESCMTGEPLAVSKTKGDKVSAATVLQSGWIIVEATAVGADTALAEIIRLVDEATSSKAPIERIADTISGIFVPVVIVIALITLGVWLALGASVGRALSFAVSVLVISCPCALGLATPTAVMVGMGRGARFGILIKNAEALERACRLKTVVFDKTGTLTEGKPKVSDFVFVGAPSAQLQTAARESARAIESAAPEDQLSDEQKEILLLLKAVEEKSEHPLAQAISAYVDERISQGMPACSAKECTGATAAVPALSSFEQIPGAGLVAKTEKETLIVGNALLMERSGVDVGIYKAQAKACADAAKTALFFAINSNLRAFFAVSDLLRPTSAAAFAELHTMGIEALVLSGDTKRTCQAVAKELKADEVIADVLPDQKEEKIKELLSPKGLVAMVGDGINDAPALARADIGIAIGAGTDVAISSADIVLMHSDPLDVPRAIDLSRACLRKIKMGLFWALFYNSLCIPIAAGIFSAFGLTINPMIAAGAMGLSSVFVVSNALLLRRWHPRYVSVVQTEHTVQNRVDTKGIEQTDAMSTAQVCSAVKGEQTMHKQLKVTGMMCEHCVMHVRKAVEAIEGVSNVNVCLDEARVEYDCQPFVKDARVIAAIQEAGYSAQVLE